MFEGWKVDGKLQQEPPDEFWEKLDRALREVLGITIFPDKADDEAEQRKSGLPIKWTSRKERDIMSKR